MVLATPTLLRRSEPALDYTAPHRASSRRSLKLALLEGFGSIFAPFQGLSDVEWWASPHRDQVVVGTDMWEALWQYERESDVHPSQERLFDPSGLGS
jgi:hypothetical protein